MPTTTDDLEDGQEQQQGEEVHQIFLVRRIKEANTPANDQGVYQGTGIVDVEVLDGRKANGPLTLLESSARLSPGSVGTVAVALGNGSTGGNWIDVEAYIPDEDKSRLEIIGTTKHRFSTAGSSIADLFKFRIFKYRVKEDADIDSGHAQIRFNVEEESDQETQYRRAKGRVYVYIEDRTLPSISITRAGPAASPGNPTEDGGTATFNLKLGAMPGLTTLSGEPGKVSISITSLDASLLTAAPATLNFTRQNWNVNQTVTLTGGNDIDAVDDSVGLEFAATGGRFDEATGGSIDLEITENFTVIDDDATFVISDSTLEIGEGGNTTLKVRLKGMPSANVSATLSSSDIGAVTVAPVGLSFTASNWNMDQTVTVRAIQDFDATNESVNLVVRASGAAEFQGKQVTASIEVDDDEIIDLTLTPTSLTMDEGEEKTLTVNLTSQPTGTVTVNVTQTGTTNADVRVDKSSLTFTTSNWSQAQEVKVSATQDDDAADDSATLRLSASGADYAGVSKDISVTVSDDDEEDLILSSTDLGLVERANVDLTVRLATKPTDDVRVNIAQLAGTTNNAITVSPNHVTFTTSNWNEVQTFTVTGVEDDDTDDEETTFVVSTTGANYSSVSKQVSVRVTDNDSPGLTLSSAGLEVNEGGSASFKINLSTQPGSNVTVTVDPDTTNTDVTVTNASLTFTDTNWNAEQTVTVNAAEDDNTSDESATLKVSASGDPGYSALSTIDVVVRVKDNDTESLTLPTDTVAITEGETATFDIKLSTQPSANVTVTLTQPTNTDVTVDTDTGTEENQNTLTFTSVNWNTAQTVTVKAAEDGDAVSESASIPVSASGGGYDDITGTVRVSVTEDDLGLFSLPLTTVIIDEGGSANFKVKLSAQPNGNVTVNLVSNSAGVTVDTNASTPGNQTELTFTTANWNADQTVTVSAAEDNDDTENENTTISVSATGGGYAEITGTVGIRVIDDDTGSFILPSAVVNVDEGDTATFVMKLSAQPSGNVTVNFNQPANTDVKVDTDTVMTGNQTELTFTTTNWDRDQRVTVKAAEDNDDTSDEDANIQVSAAGGGYGDAIGTVRVRVTDDEAGLFVLPSSPVALTEGESATFDVKLSDAPSGSVTMTFAPPTNADVNVDTDSGRDEDQNTLTFTTSNWNVNQSVTVRAAEDDDDDDENSAITVTASGGGYGEVSGTVRVDLTDDEAGLFILPSADVAITEGGTATFNVRLSARPSANVTVMLAQPINADVSVVDASLTFTTSNWNVNQSVTVRAAEDRDDDHERAAIPVSATGGGYGETTGTVSVAVTDNDEKIFVLPSSAVALTEGGTATFVMKLAVPPTANVTVTFAPPTNTDVTLDTDTIRGGNQDTLTFTALNWDSDQTVTIKAAEDSDVDNESANISVSATGGGYNDATGTVRVTLTDDDLGTFILPSGDVGLTEGESATFDIKLSAQPTANVTMTLTQPTNRDVTVDTDTNASGNQTTLIFTTGNWNVNQTVTVSAAEDGDNSHERAQIPVSAAGGGYGEITGTVGVYLRDDDLGYFRFDSQNRTSRLYEGEQPVSIGVKLSHRPSGNVTVTASPPTNTKVRLGTRTSVTFTQNNWHLEKFIAVRGVEDNDADDEPAEILYSGAGGGYGEVTGTLSFTLKDDDAGIFNLPTGSIALTEGGSKTFDVSLSGVPDNNEDVTLTFTQPTAKVKVDTDGSASNDQNTLTFTSDNWNVNQNVTVRALEDDGGDNESVNIPVRAMGGGYDDITGNIRVNVTDDEGGNALTLPSDTVSVAEGGSATFQVQLSAQPDGNVTVTLTQPSNTDVTVSPASLTFTTSSWNSDKTVTVNAAEDNDTTNDDVTLALSASGGGYNNVTGSVSVRVTDDDAGSLTISPTTVSVDEGSSVTFDVKLSARPTANVRVNVNRSNNSDVTTDKSSLTFTTSNWNVNQQVRVSAAEDNNDTANETATISMSASGGGYDDATGTVRVDVTDDDTGTLTLSTTSVTVREGASATFKVKLSAQPSAAVTVTLPPITNTDVTVDKTSLTFNSGNWSSDQTITVRAAEDNDDTANETASVTLSAEGGGYDDISGTVSVNVTDDDKGLFTITPTTVDVDEGSNATFQVRLSALPSDTVTVTLVQPTNTDVTVDKTSLTFTTSNWNANQAVRVSASEDNDDADNEDATVTLTASGGGYGEVTGIVTVNVTDDDAGLLVLSTTSMSIGEGNSANFYARLSAAPSAPVTVTLEQPTNTDVTVDKTSLTFTASNWNANQRITVSAAEDNDNTENETASITLSASGGGYGEITGNVTVNVTDDDEGTLDISTVSLLLPEGQSASFTVKLSAQPSDDVTVTLDQPTNTDVRLRTTSLTFTTANWNLRQPVIMDASEDNDDTEDENVTITLNASGGGYDDATGTVAVTLLDDDIGSLVLSTTSVTVGEGSSATFMVKLSARPTLPVTVTLPPITNTDVTVDKTSLTFDSDNWSRDQTITVNAAEDNDDTEDETASITLNASGSGYDDATGSVTVNITDDDEGTLTLSATSVTVGEGSSTTFMVKLSAEPSASVTVMLKQPDNTDVTVDKTSLTFTTTNWSSDQTITVRAAEDNDDTEDENALIILDASGGGYDDGIGRVTARVTDDDAGTFTLPSAAVAITEGSTATFNMKLSAVPTATVTVTLQQPSNTDVKVDTDTAANGDQNTLTFTAANWNVDQPVTISAAEDNDDADDETAEIQVSATGGGYGDITGTVRVDVTDDDEGLLTLSTTSVTVGEGSSATFDVRLSALPRGTVTVTLPSIANTDVTVDKTSLTFTTGNWDADQTITVRAAEDNDDTEDETASIVLNASGGGYGEVTGAVSVSVTDDDTGTLTLSTTSVTVGEGAGTTFKVKLSAQPSAAVTVTLPSITNTDVTVDKTSLTFNAGNWSTDQTITVNAAEDNDDTEDETASIVLNASGGGYDDATGTVTVSVTDDDAGTLTLSTTSVTVGEGSSTTFKVKLSAQPSAAVTVTLPPITNTD
ncbi:MAG: hypothetical protein ISN28_09775, partial [Ectothiorhodospiraceae bacterium AqS1]|nr:hypothetical protein [Ectothiorhodospiraceae bacterium AqS1]